MTKEELSKSCMKYAKEYVDGHIKLPQNPAEANKWNRADFLEFKTRASKAVSQIEIDIKAAASEVSDKVYEELILSLGGEKA